MKAIVLLALLAVFASCRVIKKHSVRPNVNVKRFNHLASITCTALAEACSTFALTAAQTIVLIQKLDKQCSIYEASVCTPVISALYQCQSECANKKAARRLSRVEEEGDDDDEVARRDDERPPQPKVQEFQKLREFFGTKLKGCDCSKQIKAATEPKTQPAEGGEEAAGAE
eukprot:TRINITY_DN2886_c0_g1_i2.p1 TRINITY_DN2886_c0_g1~~TRINITY_DN2886_c0_g1_i2.p1  ORF type:complete len:171 (-),score=52.63 TRINITY_DN2886_c0_g1_i2:125-637(-)